MAKRSRWKWNRKKEEAARLLAEGREVREAAEAAGVTPRTVTNWLNIPDFFDEVNRLTFQTELATRAGRLRALQRIVRNKVEAEGWTSQKDLLDILKALGDESDGAVTGVAEALADALKGRE